MKKNCERCHRDTTCIMTLGGTGPRCAACFVAYIMEMGQFMLRVPKVADELLGSLEVEDLRSAEEKRADTEDKPEDVGSDLAATVLALPREVQQFFIEMVVQKIEANEKQVQSEEDKG